MSETDLPRVFVMDRHLGGYFEGGDPDTMYPNLWHWFVNDLGVKSVLDVGCGDGAAIEVFSRLGAEAWGVDGMPQEDPRIVTHDYTTGPRDAGGSFDLVWSAEFVEHVEEQFIPNFMQDFCRAPIIAMTHAVPGQTGHHHVNCQPSVYWEVALEVYGYELDKRLTEEARAKARFHTNPENYFVKTGMVFIASP